MADFEPLYVLLASDRAQFLGGPFARRQSWQWIAAEVGSWSLKGFGSWGVELRKTGDFVGQIGINQPHHFPELEIGWIFSAQAEGKGYARQGATAILDWVRSSLKPETLVSYIDPQNLRSIVLAKRLGALPDPDALRPDGDTKQDTIVYRHAMGVVQ
jgi:RimJ/RimL family protein N-acetyltransferase